MTPPRPQAAARRRETLTALAAGALQTLAFVHTWAWPLPLLTLAWLVSRLDAAATPRRAAWLGFCYGWAWLAAGTWWLFVSMHRYGGLAAPLAAAAVVLLAAALSLYLAAAGAAYARWRRGTGLDALLFAALWLLAELARGVLFTGFPWLASGYAQVDGPLAALAPYVGVYGIGAATAFAAVAVVLALRSRLRQWQALAITALLAAPALAPVDYGAPAGRFSAALLQTGVSQDRKFKPEHLPRVLADLAQALRGADATLVLAPETAIPLLPAELDAFSPGYLEALRAHFASPGAAGPRAALVGIPLGDFERGYTNSVLGLSAAPDQRYDKHHLVPFGEFVPTGFRWFVALMNIPLGDFARGPVDAPPFALAGQRVAPHVCYEDLFGEELARRFGDAATAPTVLANHSNIAWFGDTIAIAQHLHIARLRALELQRPVLRATNTGATAHIDHRGVVRAQLPGQLPGQLRTEVEGRSGLTPFARWASRFGLWPLLGAALVALAGAVLARVRREPSHSVDRP